ncbi:MAG: hypothetical protein C0428_18875 [Polaromonas sp.]|nr:hypothetical protein [Polaromonas sp.]
MPAPAGRGLPGGNSLFFVSPKKSKQKKGDPTVCVPPSLTLRRATCGARSSRGLARTRLRLRQSRSLIRLDLRSSAHTEGWWGRKRDRIRDRAPARARFARPRLPELVLVFDLLPPPVGLGPRSAGENGSGRAIV